MSEKRMLESVCKELSFDKNIKVLSEAPLRRLQPILLDAWGKRAYAKSPSDILNLYEQKHQFFGVSGISQKELMKFCLVCFEAVPDYFNIVETSPVTPLGLNAVLSSISPNNTLATIRDMEVVGDVTTQLALECALQRRRMIRAGQFGKSVHLCSSHRVLRMQPFDSSKGYMQHFNLLGLCSGGRGFQGKSFAVQYMREHISIIIEMIDMIKQYGLGIFNVSVNLSDINFLEKLIVSLNLPREEINRYSLDDDFSLFEKYNINFPKEIEYAKKLTSEIFLKNGLADKTAYYTHLEDHIISPLREKFPDVRFCFDFERKAGLGYYKHICFHIFARTQKGDLIQVADGGAVDWLEKLLQHKKEGMVASGIGSELIHKLF